MTRDHVLAQIDRWGTVLLIYLLPWQARWIFVSGSLAGAPSEFQTVSVAAIEVLIVGMVVVRILRPLQHSVLQTTRRVAATFAVLVALAFVSILIAGDRAAAAFGAIHLLEGLAILWLVLTAPRPREARIAFVVSLCVQAAIGIVQVLLQRVYPSTILGIAAHFPEVPGTSVVAAGGMRFLRAYGTFPHPNILGGALALGILLMHPLPSRGEGWGEGWSVRTVSTLAITALLTVGLFFTFSRIAWIALAVGLVFQLVQKSHVRDKSAHAGIVIIVVVFAILAALFAPLLRARVSATGRLETKSITTRLASLRDAQALFVLHPLTGVGVSNFTYAFSNEIDPARNGYDLEPAHSAPLTALAEIGLFGFGVFILLLFYCFKDAFKADEIGVASALIILALGDHWVWTTLGGILIFWAAWGVALRKS